MQLGKSLLIICKKTSLQSMINLSIIELSSLCKRPVLMPKDNNPLEGINNGIKARITEYVKVNIGTLLDKLATDLSEKVEKFSESPHVIWQTKLRIPFQAWKYARCLEKIFASVSVKLNHIGNDQKFYVFIGEKYAFQTYLDEKDKNQVTNQFRVQDKMIKIEKNATDEDITDFFKTDIFYKPNRFDMEVCQNPKQAKSLNDCFTLCAIKKLTIRTGFDDSSCTCQDFKLVGYCLHLISGLMYYGKVQAPLAIAAPGTF